MTKLQIDWISKLFQILLCSMCVPLVFLLVAAPDGVGPVFASYVHNIGEEQGDRNSEMQRDAVKHDEEQHVGKKRLVAYMIATFSVFVMLKRKFV